jgi:uncharacterized protein (DUF305 family)
MDSMVNKASVYGIIGFLLGGLVVSSAATFLDKPDAPSAEHSSSSASSLQSLKGDDYDKAFIKEMISHHEGAIEMARRSPEQAKHAELKQLSQAIITAQEAEITQLKQWQTDWGYTDNAHSNSTSH